MTNRSDAERRIVGVLQNPWFPPDTLPRHVELFRTNYDFRRRVLARSHTGKMLWRVFGAERFNAIYWTDASFVAGDVSNHKSKPDFDFLEQELKGASVVIAFGRVAQNAMRALTLGGLAKQQHNFKYVEALHPASRNRAAFIESCAEALEAFALAHGLGQQ